MKKTVYVSRKPKPVVYVSKKEKPTVYVERKKKNFISNPRNLAYNKRSKSNV